MEPARGFAGGALAVLIVLGAPALAGCVGGPLPDAPARTGGVGTSGGAGVAAGQSVGDRVRLTYHLAPGHRLVPGPPPAEAAPARVPADPVANAFVNEETPAWTGPAPGADLLVEGNATVVLHYASDAPAAAAIVREGQGLHFVPWVGSGRAYAGSGAAYGPAVVAPGAVHRAVAEVPLPDAGFRLEADRPVRLLLATLLTSTERVPVDLLVGAPATPSRIEVDATVVPPLPDGPVEARRQTGVLPGNGAAFTPVPHVDGWSRAVHDLEVGDAAGWVEVRLVQAEPPAGKFDVDIALLAPDGTAAAEGSTPFMAETAVLWPETLDRHGRGAWGVEVTSYSGVLVRYRLDVRVHAAG